MGPRFAPLALLLLALYGQSSAYGPIKIESFTGKSTTSTASITCVPPAKKEEFIEKVKTPPSSSGKPSDAQLAQLLGAMPNTMMLMAFVHAKLFDLMPDPIQRAIVNGVLCESEDTALPKVISQALYSADTVPDDKHTMELALQSQIQVDCAKPASPPTAEHTCLCTEKKPILYCMQLFFKTHSPKTGFVQKDCPKVAMQKLKGLGTGTMGQYYDDPKFGEEDFSKQFDGTATVDESERNAKLFCDAADEKVKDGVRALYASDGGPWIIESLVYTILFGDSGRTLDEACGDSKFTGNAYGKCVCGKDTGFTFCIYEVFGKFFKEKGYLNCNGATASFVSDNKPKALPVLAKVPKSAASAFSLVFAAATLLLLH